MTYFNQKSRRRNIILSSSIGTISDVVKVLLGFAYRTLFLHFLSADYLGLNGLFSNILQILSLAELGISTSITYRFYKPISENNVEHVGQLMNFFRKIYHIIAIVILCIGLAIVPFIKYLINDSAQVPSDVNIYVIYLLFLLNTVSTYVFAYKLTLLNADQRTYEFNIINLIASAMQYIFQIIVVATTRNYTLTLLIGIIATLSVNFISSIWVTKQYKEVFEVPSNISKNEEKSIFSDTKALMYHKVGYTVLTGTDSAILSAMVSLTATGLYSNYSLIITNLENFFSKLFGNFISSIGNAKIKLQHKDYYKLFENMNFLNIFSAACASLVLYACIDDFIELWLGKFYVFSRGTSFVLCLEFYLVTSTVIASTFTNAAGLFVKDRVRPLIEALINLVVSIVLTKQYGIFGVFAGTVVSNVCTVWWRIPYVLYKFDFTEEKLKDYWKSYMMFFIPYILGCFSIDFIKKLINIRLSWVFLFLEFFIVGLAFAFLMILLYFKTDGMKYCFNLIFNLKQKILNRVK